MQEILSNSGLHEPLVSVGIPTFNRAEGLQKAVDCILNQTYGNLEIIVSDNNSTDPRVQDILNEFVQEDQRITIYRQSENRGAFNNFRDLIDRAHGKLFMWAADDDIFYDFYISKIVSKFQELCDSSVVAITMEAQYFDGKDLFPFFKEGKPFYDPDRGSIYGRLASIIRHNYGNLLYSVYKLEVLRSFSARILENEIPFLLQVAARGSFLVLPEIGFLKKTSFETYRQARWEKQGGRLPGGKFSLKYYGNLAPLFEYHKRVLANIKDTILETELNEVEKQDLLRLSEKYIHKHFRKFLFQFGKKEFD